MYLGGKRGVRYRDEGCSISDFERAEELETLEGWGLELSDGRCSHPTHPSLQHQNSLQPRWDGALRKVSIGLRKELSDIATIGFRKQSSALILDSSKTSVTTSLHPGE